MAATAQVYCPPLPSKKLEAEQEAENEENSNWNKCCCCHVTKGLTLIGTLQLFLLLAELGSIIATYVLIEGDDDRTNTTRVIDGEWEEGQFGSSYKDYNWVYAQSPLAVLSVGCASAVIGITLVILMMIGVKKSKPRLLVPHTIGQLFGVLGLLAGSALFIYAAVKVSASKTCTEVKRGDACTKVLLTYGAFIAVFTVLAAIQIYFIIITVRGYRYIKEKCKRYQSAPSPYYAIYQRQYQQQLQQLQQQQQQANAGQQQQHQQQPMSAGYMHQHQPIYASYAQPMAAYNYGYRYA